jgi:drug/metabolite transporter (DMT)-like permease
MWIMTAISSYFISAGIHIADKFLLSNKVHSSIVYAFFVGIWSVFNIFLLFLDPWMPGVSQMAVDLSAGFLFLVTLVFWYKALHQSEATRVVPIVGALVPIFCLVLSAFFLDETISNQQFIAFFILIFGGVLISVRKTEIYLVHKVYERIKVIFGDLLGKISAQYRPTRRLLFNSFLSALLFSVFYVYMKYIYLHQPFIGAFAWSRMGSFIGAMLILLVPSWREKIKEHQGEAKKPKNLAFFLGVRILASVAFIILNLAISRGNVAMVNALQGTQYLFLIIFVLLISSRFPRILKEELGRGVMLQKLIGVFLVGLGLYVLVT